MSTLVIIEGQNRTAFLLQDVSIFKPKKLEC